MAGYLSRRMLHSAIALVGLIVAVFFLARLTGDPVDLFLPVDASQATRAEFARVHGFDRPVVEQFVDFVRGVMQGDFGESIRKQRPAMDLVMESYPVTLQLAAVTMLFATAMAMIVGALADYRPGGAFDRLSNITSLAGASAPDFWVAISCILLFAVSLRWLPTSGIGGVEYWILPVFVLALRPFGLLTQVVRGAMIGALAAPYVNTARAKGMSENRVIFVHALRNACVPLLTVAGELTVGLINGAVIVETVFGWPGIGKLMIDAVIQRDFAIAQAAILVTAVAIFLLNIIIDLLYVAVDPRIRHQ